MLNRRLSILTAGILLCGLLTLRAGAAPALPMPPGGAIAPPPTTQQQKTLLVQMQDAFTRIAQTVEPAVVNIKAEQEHPADGVDLSQGEGDPGTGGKSGAPFSGITPRTPRRSEATGSGVIVRADGYILTNDHVVEGASGGHVLVTLFDGRQFQGKVYPDFKSDLAVVKIDPGTLVLPAATFADSSEVRPGQWAVAVGSPFDLQNTMTVGIISAVGRHQTIPGETAGQGRYYPDLLQTDAAINPGNSGGPLFNIDGQVVGINVAIESPVEGSAGVGFAIPSVVAQQIMTSLIQSGKVVRGYLGLTPDDLTPAEQEQFNVREGVFVRDVSQDSPAGKAGVQASDIVTVYDGKIVTDENGLRRDIAATLPGKRVSMTILRDGQPRSILVTLASPPAPADNAPPPAPMKTAPKDRLGLTVRTLTARDRQSLGLLPDTSGVLVLHVASGGAAEFAALSLGIPLTSAVIQKVNRTSVHDADSFSKALAASPSGASVLLVALYLDPGDGQTHQIAFWVRP